MFTVSSLLRSLDYHTRKMKAEKQGYFTLVSNLTLLWTYYLYLLLFVFSFLFSKFAVFFCLIISM
uniref:Defective in cullin neddylation protein n=1 Tax=Rhizophora mucronata TaxID=61149 RepID=A0A2P2LHM6_RHIMU